MNYKRLYKDFKIDVSKIDDFLSFLLEKNKVMNLTSITDKDEAIEKHIYDSLLISKEFDFNNKEILDVGSGGGFPGIPLAIMYPNAHFTLLDSTSKKTKYLNEVVSYLKLKNVKVINSRVESLNEKEKYDVVISRAFADLPIYLELVTYLAKVGGFIIALKGSKGLEELKRSENAIDKLDLKLIKIQKEILPTLKENRINLIFRKDKSTNKKYPRMFSLIKLKSL